MPQHGAGAARRGAVFEDTEVDLHARLAAAADIDGLLRRRGAGYGEQGDAGQEKNRRPDGSGKGNARAQDG